MGAMGWNMYVKQKKRRRMAKFVRLLKLDDFLLNVFLGAHLVISYEIRFNKINFLWSFESECHSNSQWKLKSLEGLQIEICQTFYKIS